MSDLIDLFGSDDDGDNSEGGALHYIYLFK